jgi:hypothetical protein
MPLTLPTDLITQALRLVNNLIEGDPTRTAQYVAMFWLFWPLWKPRFTPEQQAQIEGLVKAIQPASPKGA